MTLLTTLQGLVHDVAPRNGHVDIGPDVDLGFGGFGMTIVEYLTLLQRIEDCFGVRVGDGTWPRTLHAISERVTSS